MALTFNSKSIKKVVDIDNIQKLSSPEIRLLKEELERAIETLAKELGNLSLIHI